MTLLNVSNGETEVHRHLPGHIASKWQSQESNSALTSNSLLLTPMLHIHRNLDISLSPVHPANVS